MALDHLENYKMESVASHKKLPYGVVESVVNLKNKILADRVGKPQGVYVTYDTSGALHGENCAVLWFCRMKQPGRNDATWQNAKMSC